MDNTAVIERLHTEKLATITKTKRKRQIVSFLISPVITLIMLEILRADFFLGYLGLGVLPALAKYAIT